MGSQTGTPRNGSQPPRTPASASTFQVPGPNRQTVPPGFPSSAGSPNSVKRTAPNAGLTASSVPTPTASGVPGTQQDLPPRLVHRKTTNLSPKSVSSSTPTINNAIPDLAGSAISQGPTQPQQQQQQQVSRQASPPVSKPFIPDFIRNYVPHQRLVDKVNGFDLKVLNTYGEQLDHLKPVFLYFPELGRIDINALSMSLASNIDAEINVALNVLLIVTSDPSVAIPLYELKERKLKYQPNSCVRLSTKFLIN
ncbi:unnamed protein product [Ambrosiozyma monospora]|uniref:Unnamed protein product n=1 Tax=Ambrosiozyma monospora TaxID=43982 RepID=A0ACB5UBB4_AMBMO|nr:unnamed protein product [Ambrosiozyma monospora]